MTTGPTYAGPAFPAAGRPPGYYPLTIAAGIRASVERTPAKTAMIEGERSLTYSQLVRRIDRITAATAEGLGLVKGDHVAMMMPNCLEFMEIVCGLSEAGVAPAMVPPMADVAEVRQIVVDSGAKAVFTHGSLEEVARAAAGDLVEDFVVVGGNYDDWLSRARDGYCGPPVDEEDVFSIPYTSGSTGRPKGVMLSHRARVLICYAKAMEYGCYSSATRALATTPMFHGSGFIMALAPVFFGGFLAIMPRFDIERLLHEVSIHAVNSTYMIPTHFAEFFRLPASVVAAHDLRSLETIISGTAPLDQGTKERIMEHFGEGVLHERYGSTEAAIVTNLRPEDQLRKQRCVGLPFPLTEVRVLDDAGNEVPPGTVGELHSRSPFMFNGYWGRDEATAEAMRDGWLSVGDMAWRDEEGYVYLVDRKNDMIISGGENIYPREVEEVLLRHPAVAEAAVVGMPDDYWGEAVTAFIVAEKGSTLDQAEIRGHCGEGLARWKVPKAVHFLEALPRNSLGKVLRRELKKRRLSG